MVNLQFFRGCWQKVPRHLMLVHNRWMFLYGGHCWLRWLSTTLRQKWKRVTYILQSSIAYFTCFPFQDFVPVHPYTPTKWKILWSIHVVSRYEGKQRTTMKNGAWPFKELHKNCYNGSNQKDFEKAGDGIQFLRFQIVDEVQGFLNIFLLGSRFKFFSLSVCCGRLFWQ